MALIKKTFLLILIFCVTNVAVAHLVYAPNDIPLLDNRFRIDPYTDSITFILNHSQGKQRVILVRPDGSKLSQEKHPESVAWVSSKKQDIITIENPMAGPWQAIANLDGPDRIKLISKVQLKIKDFPLKLYAQEYIRTRASLYYDNKVMTDPSYLKNASLSVSLIAPSIKLLTLYKDDGQSYDALPFDGDLTAHIFIDLLPGRYLINFETKNNVFLRVVNKDAIVFPSPITYKIKPLKKNSNIAVFNFKINTKEIDPNSVIINGVITDKYHNRVENVILHSVDNTLINSVLSTQQNLDYQKYSFSGKVFATTLTGREIELQLKNKRFELIRKTVKVATIKPKISEPIVPEADKLKKQKSL
ncbi:hypothetical protein [Psychromonas sp. CD1]|uniref:hypothetical protein n=1 Tax=Psychromonas sp. CD1 TaxID=1979839 RepID=UPI000B9A5378|nr:hypothetical protein [Psychromonas sp. CD1]